MVLIRCLKYRLQANFQDENYKVALGLDLNCAQPSISPIPLYQEILPPADIEQARSDITRINDVMKTISSIL
ncbi:unnamed protein product [Rotaria sp. Silwood1]|nr:unnamed protein product [Rotaria sp. Silwood1]